MERDDSQAKGHTQEKAHVRLSLASLLTMAFLGIAAIALAYIGGVMSGRHSCPVPETPATAPLANAPAQENSPVLSASELAFARELRGENNRVARLSPATEEKKPEAAPARTETAQVKAQEKASEKTDAPRKASVITVAEPEKEITAKNNSAIYDHVFQVGAFRDENAVDKLRQKLEGHGLRTAMQKEGKVFVVLVRLRGTPERAAEVAALAQSLGLGKPVQRSRLPVKE